MLWLEAVTRRKSNKKTSLCLWNYKNTGERLIDFKKKKKNKTQ